jgi:hypothetical protein
MPVFLDFHGINKRVFSPCCICIILLFFQVSISYCETILFDFSSANPDPRLENLLYVAAGIELMQTGISSTQKDDRAAMYVLSTRYDSANGKTSVHYRFFARNSPEKILADKTFEVNIDPGFDAVVAIVIRQVLKLSGIRFIPSPDAKIDGILSMPRTTKISDQNPTARGDTDSPGEQTANPKIDFSCSMAGITLFGDITRFIHYGISSSLGAGCSWRNETWNIMLGGRLTAASFFNDTGILGGPFYMLFLGPDVLFGTGKTFSYDIAMRISAGAAILAVAGTDTLLAKTVPYADAGVSITIPIGSGFSIGLGVEALVIFDSDMIIAGASTGLVIGMEL